MKWKLETQIGTGNRNGSSLASHSSPCFQILITFFASLALFPGLYNLQYFCIGKCCGQQWLEMGLSYPGAWKNRAWIWSYHLLQAIKTGSGRRSGNEAAKEGILALFQDQVKLLPRSDCSQSHAQTLGNIYNYPILQIASSWSNSLYIALTDMTANCKHCVVVGVAIVLSSQQIHAQQWVMQVVRV